MKQRPQFFAVAFLFLLVIASACEKSDKKQSPDNLSNKVILQWNEVAFETMGGAANQHTLLASRIYAMVHMSMHDAVNAIHPVYETYAFAQKRPGVNPEIAAASAANQVLKVTFPERSGYVDSVLNAFLSTFPENESISKAVALGVDVANKTLSLGFNSNGGDNPVAQPAPAVKPGDYKVVQPFSFIFAPFWENSKLFSLDAKDQFRCPPPPAVESNEYATAFNEVKEIGKLNSATRSADQTFYAKYWYEFSPEGWNRIGRVVAENKKSGLYTTARLFALMNFALADSYVAGWDSKLHYNFWRPLTAIRDAANDGNETTVADLNWLPSEPTPPIQDYPSTHSTLGNAAALVLAHIYGDKTSFTMASPTAVPAGATRSFTSFSQAADENALSRVMAGIHFWFSCEAGQELGNKIGKWTVENHLKPLK
ncbi:MAG TPA: phosphatase PAP2 family protein [Chitinophagaceae bacterium]